MPTDREASDLSAEAEFYREGEVSTGLRASGAPSGGTAEDATVTVSMTPDTAQTLICAARIVRASKRINGSVWESFDELASAGYGITGAFSRLGTGASILREALDATPATPPEAEREGCGREGCDGEGHICVAPTTLDELEQGPLEALYALLGRQPATDENLRSARGWLSGVLWDRSHTGGAAEPRSPSQNNTPEVHKAAREAEEAMGNILVAHGHGVVNDLDWKRLAVAHAILIDTFNDEALEATPQNPEGASDGN